MNSATYRACSQFTPVAAGHDPENRLRSKFMLWRLDTEAIRDSLLAVSGRLDRTVGGTIFRAENKKRVTMSPNDSVYASVRRSVYLPSIRIRSFEIFSIFDVSDSGQHVAQRPQTMVAQQALFLMNNPLVLSQAHMLAEGVSQQVGDFALWLNWLYLTLYGRPARSAEVSALSAVLSDLTTAAAHQNAEDSARRVAWEHLIRR